MTGLDEARAVRAGEELDTTRLGDYLRSQIAGLTGEPDVQQFAGGASNLTYLLRFGEQTMVLRRPPIGAAIKSAHDMVREAQVMSALLPVYPYVPKVLAFLMWCI